MIVTINKKLSDAVVPEQVRASAIVPVLAYEEDSGFFLIDDQTIGFGFICQPLPGADAKIQQRVKGFLNQTYPANTVLQFILFRSPDIEAELLQMESLRDGFHDELLSSTIRERIDFLQNHTTERLVASTEKGYFDNGLIQDLKLIVTCKVPIKGHVPTEKETEELTSLQTKVRTSLNTIGVRPLRLTAQGYLRVTNTILNWGPDAGWKRNSVQWEQDRPLCEQVFDYDTDITVGRNTLKFGEQHVRVLSAKKLPELFYFGDAVTYVGDTKGGDSAVRENYMVVVNAFFPDPEHLKNGLERKRQVTNNQAFGPMLKFVPILGEKKRNFDILNASMNDGAKPMRMSYSVVVFAPTEERAEAASMKVRNIWSESHFEMMEDKFVALPIFINCLPLCADRLAVRDLFRYKTITTEEAAVLLPIMGEWKGTGTPHTALISRNGQIMTLSLHDSDTNKNLLIAAESGSGKSFLVNELIFSYLSEGAQVWVIDAGKSYKKLSRLLHGEFVEFDDESAVCVNPFELIQNYEDEEDTVVSLVSSMASMHGRLSEWQVAAMKQNMAVLWAEKGRALKVDDIAERCLESTDQRLRDVGTQLYPFTAKGSYGRYFSGKNNVAFDAQFTVLELDELQGRKHLRQVVLLQLIYQIQQEVFLGERNRKKIVIVDEAWDLLKEGEVATFMEHAYRKFRKYGGSMVIATQSINDLYENPAGRAIAENSASMYLLGQTGESVESVKRSGRLTMSDGAFHMLRTVSTIAGVYAEIFVKSKMGIGVGRLIVGDFQKLLYSTDPVDVNDIDTFVQQGQTVPQAINSVIRARRQARAA